MAEPNFEEYLREREQIEKRMNMERLMEEFKEDMRKKRLWSKNKWHQHQIQWMREIMH